VAFSPIDGLDVATLDGYLHSAGIGRNGEPHAQLISSHRSNLTDLVHHDSSRWVLADLHAVDLSAAGLGDFGKPTGGLDRPVRRSPDSRWRTAD
jgi:hypothetical protein